MIIRNNRVITPTNERQVEAENLDVEIGNLESAANNLDTEIDKLPERNAGAYDVIQTINGDECHLSIKDAKTESYYANKMRSIIDGSVTELTEQDLIGVATLRNYIFYGCTSLRIVNIPSTITSIGESAFRGCINLISLTMSEGIITIKPQAFQNCNIATITIPSSVTSIGYQAFMNLSRLTSITIPASVTSIGDYAFYNGDALKKVVYEGQAPIIKNAVFYYCPVALYDFRNCTTVPQLATSNSLGHATGCQIVIPDALYDEWQQATNWSSLTDVAWVKASEYVEVN